MRPSMHDAAAHSLAKIKWRTAPSWDASPEAPDASNRDEQRRFATLGLAEYAAQGPDDLALLSLSALQSSAAAGVKLEENTSGTLVRSKSWTLIGFQPDASAAIEQQGARRLEQCSVHGQEALPEAPSRSDAVRVGQEALPEPPRADDVVKLSDLQALLEASVADLDYDSETTSEGEEDEDDL